MQLFKTLLFIFCTMLVSNIYAEESIQHVESEVLRIDDCASGKLPTCGKILVGAARVDQNTIQWVGTPKKEMKRMCGFKEVGSGVSVCEDGTPPETKPIEENTRDILESIYISIGSKNFGITGNKSYSAGVASNEWIFEKTNTASILVAGTLNSPSIGLFIAPTKVGVFSENITYQLSSTRNNELTEAPETIKKNLTGEGVLDGSGENAIITLDISVDDKYTPSECLGIPGCDEIVIPTGDTVNFKIKSYIDSQLLESKGLDKNLHKHAKISLIVREVNDVCPGSTTEKHIEPQTSNINKYYDYLNSTMPSIMLRGCIRTYYYLMSIDENFTVLTSRNLKDLGKDGYIDYTFYVEGHYDIANPENSVQWAGKGYQTIRLRTGNNIPTIIPTETEKVSLKVEIQGDGIVISPQKNINCGTICQADFNTGTTVQLTANPSNNVTWSGDCSQDGKVNLSSGNKTCTVTFNKIEERNNPPIGQITKVFPSSGFAPLKVTLEAVGSDPDGDIITYKWSSDGIDNVIGNLATMTFNTIGQHIITLTVTDEHGNSSTPVETTITVNAAGVENKPPVARFEVIHNIAVDNNALEQPIILDPTISSDEDGTIKEYLWNIKNMCVIGDSRTKLSTTREIFEDKLDNGTYLINLTVTDDRGVKDDASKVITIPSLVANFETNFVGLRKIKLEAVTPLESEG